MQSQSMEKKHERAHEYRREDSYLAAGRPRFGGFYFLSEINHRVIQLRGGVKLMSGTVSKTAASKRFPT